MTYERREAILEQLKKKPTATVEQLAALFYVSEATIRCDLSLLSDEGLIKRTYGGAVLLEGRGNDAPLLMRETQNAQTKGMIATQALQFIKDGSAIMLDSSSTVGALARKLGGFNGITAITNGIKTAASLSENPGTRVLCTGGSVRENSMSLVGQHACNFIERFNADVLFFSCRGLSAVTGITESSDEETLIKRRMFEAASKKILLLTSNKLDKTYLSHLCRVDELDALICDRAPEGELAQVLSLARVQVVVTGGADS